jgi:N-acetylglucosamine-6-phosphate deacetylase
MLGSNVAQPQGQTALVNGRVILAGEVVADRVVVVSGDTIVGVVEEGEIGGVVDRVDVGGRIVAPGLMDIHIHGALGHTFNEPTTEAFGTIAGENARRGVTSILATISTASIEDIAQCLSFSRQWVSGAHEGARVLGVHLEGPYFSLEQKGAQDPNNIRTPDDGTVDRILAYRDVLKIVTFAPELPGAIRLTGALAEQGIVAAAGHSSARDEQVAEAMRAGLSHVIHLWSGQSTTIRVGPWRRAGLLEASLAFDGLTAEMIADNKHLPATLMKLAYKCLGPDRLCVVSDATSGAGLPEGARFRMGEMEYEVHEGVGMLLDHMQFAGSTTLVNEMVPVLTEVVGIPLAEAVRMASLTPARVIGADRRRGSLERGKDADLVVFEEDFTPWRTMIGGQWVYAA